MKRLAVKRLATELLAITATGVLAPGGEAHAQDAQVLHFGDDTIDAAGPVSPLVEKALQAYVYGYTPVYFDVSMQTYTNVVKPSENPNQMWAPVDQFFHVRRQQTVENTMGVAPNSDTLYTMAYLDVSKEPIIWHRPAWAGHYYVCPIHNQWADNISVGDRTNPGPIEVDYAVTGKDWHGTLPPGVRVQSEPTGDAAKDHNWLATPKGVDFMVYFRTYGPHPQVYSFSSATGQPGYIVPALVRTSD